MTIACAISFHADRLLLLASLKIIMAGSGGYISVSSVPDLPPVPDVSPTVALTTLDDLLISTAEAKYGNRITLLDTPARRAVNANFMANANIRVVQFGDVPQEIRRIAVDVAKKEFQNFSSEGDESVISVSKPVGSLKARSVEFFTSSGLVCSTAAALGAKLLCHGLSGVAAEPVSPANQSFCLDYTHQEKISVPPGRTVTPFQGHGAFLFTIGCHYPVAAVLHVATSLLVSCCKRFLAFVRMMLGSISHRREHSRG